MGKFPGFDETNRISAGSPVELQSSSSARINGSNLEDIGGTMQKIGNMLAVEQADEGINKASIAAEEAHVEAQKKAKADGSDFAQKFNEEFNTRVEPIRAELDPLANAHFDNQFRKIKTEVAVTGIRTAMQMRVDDFKVTEENNGNIIASNVMVRPDTAAGELDKIRQKYQSRIDGGVPQAIANVSYEKMRDKIAGAYVEGMFNLGKGNLLKLHQLRKELSAVEQDVNVELTPDDLAAYGLKSDGTMKINYKYPDNTPVDAKLSEVFRGISPEIKNKILDKIDAEFAKHTHVKLGAIDNALNAAYNQLVDRATLEPSDKAELAAKMSTVPPELQTQYQAKYAAVLGLENIMNIAMDPKQGGMPGAVRALKAMLPADDKPLLEKEAYRAFVVKASEALKKLSDASVDDPNKFVRNRDRDLRESLRTTKDDNPEAVKDDITKVYAAQRMHNLPLSPISRDESLPIANELNASSQMGTDQLRQSVDRFRKKYGDDTLNVMNEVYRFNPKDVTPSVILLGALDSKEALQGITANMSPKERERIKTDFAKRSEVTSRDLRDSIVGVQEELRGKFSGPMYEAVNSEIEIAAKRNVIDGDMGASSAVKSAKNDLLKNFVELDAGRGKILVGKKDEYNFVPMQRFLNKNDPSTLRLEMTTQERETTLKGPYNKTYYSPPADGREWSFENSSVYPDATIIGTPDEMTYRKLWRSRVNVTPTPDGAGVQLTLSVGGVQKPIMYKGTNTPMAKSYRELSRYDEVTGKFFDDPKAVAQFAQGITKQSASSRQKELLDYARALGYKSDAEAKAAADKIPEGKDNPYYDNYPAGDDTGETDHGAGE